MKIYIVRKIEDHTFHGLFWANTKAELWDTFDQFGDPYGFEFAQIKEPGALCHPRQGVTAVQWDELDESEDPEGISWAEFEEDERFLESLHCQNRLKWEAFPAADQQYGLIARIVRGREADNDNARKAA